MELTPLLPLVGVALGWGLKAISDYWIGRKSEKQAFRRATFYLLKAFKALFDYDRTSAHFRSEKPTIDQFEPWRARLHARFTEVFEANSKTTTEAIELLATVDPTAAVRLHNTLSNIEFAFRRDLGVVAQASPATYAEMLKTLDRLIDFTLSDLEGAALSAARRAGVFEKKRVKRWIAERVAGTAEFKEGMDEQKSVRDRATAIRGPGSGNTGHGDSSAT